MAVDPRHRAVGEHVRRIGEQLGHRDHRDPVPIDVLERPPDRVGAGHVRDHDHRHRRDERGDRSVDSHRPIGEQFSHRSTLARDRAGQSPRRV